MPAPSLLDNIAMVLAGPKFPENIGAAARSAWNMGLSRLIVVSDSEPDRARMHKMATHKAAHLIDNMELHQDLGSALAPFARVVGTTARSGRQRILEQTPRDVVADVLPLAEDNQIAFLFGPEDRGLTNDDLKYCQFISSIPTADFSSLNLAQAVAIHCYELHYAAVHRRPPRHSAPKLATSFELEGMYDHLERALLAIDFLEDKSHQYYMRNIRQFLGRIQLNARETNIIRGVCRRFLGHLERHPAKDGKGP